MSAALLASSIISGGISLGKSIVGAVQTAKANKGINKLLDNQPTYKRPDEYGQMLQSALKRSSMNEPVWMQQARDNIGGAAASARGAAERGAISSNTYGRAVGDIYSKQIDAYQNMGMQAEQWKEKQFANLQNVRQMGAGYSDTEFQENKLRPFEMRMNQFQSKRQSGGQNLWNGMEGMASAYSNFAGTKYAADTMKELYGGGGGTPPATPPPMDFSWMMNPNNKLRS